MAKKNQDPSRFEPGGNSTRVSSSIDEMLLAALERGGDTMTTGRQIISLRGADAEQGRRMLREQGMRVADARDFDDQAVVFDEMGDADALLLPEIGVAVVGGDAASERGMSAQMELAADSPYESVEAEGFVFALQDGNYGGPDLPPSAVRNPQEYLRGFLRAANAIAGDLQGSGLILPDDAEEDVLVLGATWGLVACKVPGSTRSGAGIKIAVLDTGMDLGHPDFVGRPIVSQTFVGQPVQDLHGHGTHCIGTAAGPKAPAGGTPRYGIAYRAAIYVGKVLSNSGSSVDGSVLAGMNWAIANGCQVISMSLGGVGGPVLAYTQAGQAALNKGLLIIAAAGNGFGAPTGYPANSPTIMAVASLDPSLRPSSFSNRGKIEIAAPGRDIFSSWPRPILYKILNGTSMATPHVAGCAALWAETSPNLRGMALWQRLQASARRLPFPATQVGSGLVQAPA